MSAAVLSSLIAGAALLVPASGGGQVQIQIPQASASSCVLNGPLAPPVAYKSVEALADGRVTFRLCAPEAAQVLVVSTDNAAAIPNGFGGAAPGLTMVKDATGLWSATTLQPVAADTYRYNFLVDGVRTPDPQARRFSQERFGVSSTFEPAGADGDFQTFDRAVPHGLVSTLDYWSTVMGQQRRAHVYTPPGYEKGGDPLPVLYLVHGSGDNDDSWTSVGHAQYILDNLIAAGKARPMIVVMPDGHTPPREGVSLLVNTDFGNDLIQDLIPYVDGHFRTVPTADARAMAGLSMGGAHTIQFGLTHPELFHSIGIFSIGFFTPETARAYEEQNLSVLKRGEKEMDLVYVAVGREDFLYPAIAPLRSILDEAGIRYVYQESGGGHTWINWRRYFADFAPRLFAVTPET